MFPAPYPKVRANNIVAPSPKHEATDAISSLSLGPFRKASRDTYAFSRVFARRLLSFAPISSPDRTTQSIVLDGSDGRQADVPGPRIFNHEANTGIHPAL